MTEEDCPSCKLAVGIGMYLNVCKVIDSKEKCEELFEKMTNDELEPNELFDIIKEKAKDNPEHLEMLEYIDELMEKTKT
ncbi:unnamed protein product [marine sediment metagenome]|uniref:Uncharacterized protein n=1 Tax=marine sediment metagenome TaxID=412755 RepID=X1DAU2_9ZZZZ